MSSWRHRCGVSATPELGQWIAVKIESAVYTTASEVVRDARRLPFSRNDLSEEQTAAWCRDQRCVRNDPNPRLGSDDAGIARASQIQHAVEDVDRHVDFSHPTFVPT
jgi:hypothetical protein